MTDPRNYMNIPLKITNKNGTLKKKMGRTQ